MEIDFVLLLEDQWSLDRDDTVKRAPEGRSHDVPRRCTDLFNAYLVRDGSAERASSCNARPFRERFVRFAKERGPAERRDASGFAIPSVV